MDRFFIEQDNIKEATARITGEDAAHISRVLRLKKGDLITLCDGANTDYLARIEAADKNAVLCALLERQPCKTEPKTHITLYQALPKAGKMETIIQKCVELGVADIVLVYAARCIGKPEHSEQKRLRYQRIAYEAAKQSRRGIVPRVHDVMRLLDIKAGHGLLLLAYEEEHIHTLKQALHGVAVRDVALVVGPEGGFTAEEAAALTCRGAKSVSLGPRILRTETAGMAMLAMTLYELEG